MLTTEMLAIALQLVDALAHIHDAGVIHKDIKSENIVYDPTTHNVCISDFGLASRIVRETQALTSPNVMEGTLQYISPEQTGRMNRPIDYRTDFYSLGVTFYEMLTQQLPFTATDSMELIHSHLARQPLAPHELRAEVPRALSRIVMKMMAKNAENRYQSASGLRHDLERCRAALSQGDTAQEFSLGSRDMAATLQMPHTLYGRDAQIHALMQAFERISTGHAEMMLIAAIRALARALWCTRSRSPS